MKTFLFSILFTFLIYLPSIKSDYVRLDDIAFVKNNYLVHTQDIDSIITILSKPFLGSYRPLTFLSYKIDSILWGNNPRGFHFDNIIIHLLNGILLFLFLKTVKIPENLIYPVFIIFLMHPANVESVTWISERKNLLSAFFCFLYAIFFIKSLTGSKKNYVLSLIFYILSLLSKSAAVPVPFLWFFYDIIFMNKNKKKVLLLHLPFFIFAVLGSISIIYCHSTYGGMRPDLGMTLTQRLLAIPYIIILYIYHLLLPVSLTPFYKRIEINSIFSTEFIFSCIAIAVLLLFVLFKSKKEYRNIILGGILFFIGLLTPVLNILPLSVQIADRYLYLSGIGLILSIVFLIKNSKTLQNFQMSTKNIIFFLIILTLCIVTVNQQFIWKNKYTFWKEIIRKNSDSPFGRLLQAKLYRHKGRIFESLFILNKLIKERPLYLEASIEKAQCMLNFGDYMNSKKELINALDIMRIKKYSGDHFLYQHIYNSLGKLHFYMIDFDTAKKYFNNIRDSFPVILPDIEIEINTYSAVIDILTGHDSGYNLLKIIAGKSGDSAELAKYYLKNIPPAGSDKIKNLIKIIKNDNYSNIDRTEYGQLLSKLNLYIPAIRLLKNENKNNNALYILSLCYNYTGKIDKTISILEKLYKEDNTSLKYIYSLIEVYLKIGNISRVNYYLTKLEELKSNPDTMKTIKTFRKSLKYNDYR